MEKDIFFTFNLVGGKVFYVRILLMQKGGCYLQSAP